MLAALWEGTKKPLKSLQSGKPTGRWALGGQSLFLIKSGLAVRRGERCTSSQDGPRGLGETGLGHATKSNRSAWQGPTDYRIMARFLPAPAARTRPSAPAESPLRSAFRPGRLRDHRSFTAPDASRTQLDQVAQVTPRYSLRNLRYEECQQTACACARRGTRRNLGDRARTAPLLPAEARRGYWENYIIPARAALADPSHLH